MEARPSIPDTTVVQELRVNTHSLRAFGEFMRRELDQNIAPMAGRVSPVLMSGAVVAMHLPSGDVEAMNSKHIDCITAMSEQLKSFAVNMSIIADAAAAIATRYTSSDALAGATISGISTAFGAANLQDTPPAPDTPHGGYV